MCEIFLSFILISLLQQATTSSACTHIPILYVMRKFEDWKTVRLKSIQVFSSRTDLQHILDTIALQQFQSFAEAQTLWIGCIEWRRPVGKREEEKIE